MNTTYKSLYPSIILEFNIASNTQIGRIDIFNKWKVLDKESGKIYYIKDAGNAYDFEWADIKEGNKIVKIRKQISLYEDEDFTKPIEENIDYVAEKYETIEYKRVYEHENAFRYEKQSRGGEFIENLVTDNIIELSKRWFGLAGFEEILEDISEYYMMKTNMPYIDDWTHPIRPTTKELEVPVKLGSSGNVKPVRLVNRELETKEYYHADPRKWLNN